MNIHRYICKYHLIMQKLILKLNDCKFIANNARLLNIKHRWFMLHVREFNKHMALW